MEPPQDNNEPPTLLSLTTELLLLVIETLPAVSICRFGLVSHAAQEVAHADEVWSILLDQVWPDAAAATHLRRRSATEGPALKGCMQRFAALSYGPYPEVRAVGPELTWKDSAHNEIRFGQASQLAASATSCPWGLCHGSLLSDSSPPRRCSAALCYIPRGGRRAEPALRVIAHDVPFFSPWAGASAWPRVPSCPCASPACPGSAPARPPSTRAASAACYTR